LDVRAIAIDQRDNIQHLDRAQHRQIQALDDGSAADDGEADAAVHAHANLAASLRRISRVALTGSRRGSVTSLRPKSTSIRLPLGGLSRSGVERFNTSSDHSTAPHTWPPCL